jgi:hypothetical protein
MVFTVSTIRKFNDFGIMIAGGFEDSDGFYMTEDPEPYNIKRYREVKQGLGKVTYDLSPVIGFVFCGSLFRSGVGSGSRVFLQRSSQLDQYWLNYTQKSETFGLKGLVYLNRADKTAFQDTANDNFTSPFRDEKFKGTYTWGADSARDTF